MDVKSHSVFLGLGLALTASLTACSSEEPDPSPKASASATPTAASSSSDVKVLQPGAPGEEAATGSVEPPAPAEWNHSDVAFVQMMIPHHAQALQMARLAPERSQDRSVRRLAERIEAAQGPEIVLMASWLEEQGVDVPEAADDPLSYDHADHGHDGMVGMLTAEEMEALAAARGRDFDRAFLQAMVRHHEGAMAMAGTVAVEGSAAQVNELAADISSSQTAEINRMQDVLALLG